MLTSQETVSLLLQLDIFDKAGIQAHQAGKGGRGREEEMIPPANILPCPAYQARSQREGRAGDGKEGRGGESRNENLVILNCPETIIS